MIHLSVEHLMERISRNHRNLSLEPADVAAWCYEAMEESASYEAMEESMGTPIAVVNGMGHLPLNIYRLLSVKSACGPCNETCYRRSSRCLHFPLNTNGVAYVDMLLFPSDERGYPLIDDTLMTVCYWYCLRMLLLEPFLQGTVTKQAYDEIKSEFHRAEGAARASFRNIDRAKLNRISRMVRSSVIAQQFSLRR